MTAPWLPMPAALWPSIAASISGEWPRDAAIMDLRWWDDQVRMGREKRIPGRPRLIKRWGGGAWTDWAVKMLLRNEAAWKDPRHQKPPAHRQRTASAPPASKTIADVESQPTASAPPALRQPTATRADLHKNTTTQEHTPLKPPQGGRASDEATSNPQTTLDGSAVDNSAEAVDKSTETTTTPQKPSRAAQLAELWAEMEAIRCKALNSDPDSKRAVKPRKLGQFKRNLSARLAEHSAEEILTVARWLWTSPHRRAQKLREPGYRYVTMLRPSRFRGYLEMAEAGATVDPFEAQQRPSGEQSRAGEADTAWENVRAAMAHWGRRPPGQDWGFSDDPAEDRRYLAAIKGATYRDDTREAWAHLYNNIGHHERGPKLKRSFGYHWRTARRAEVAA